MKRDGEPQWQMELLTWLIYVCLLFKCRQEGFVTGAQLTPVAGL